MSWEAVNCQNCGAPLRSGPPGTLLHCLYCGSTHRPFFTPPVARIMPDRQSEELARIDREWEEERQPYLWSLRDGSKSPITPFQVLLGGMAYLTFIAFYDVGACVAAADMAQNANPPPAVPWAPYLGLPLLGAIFTFVGICLIARNFKKALRYRVLYRRYLRRRGAACSSPPPMAVPVIPVFVQV